jgi:NADP-dependent 3-hydroxy acid dehydrogenase YdfG
MKVNQPQVILVTGASSGIGEAISVLLHQKGHIVYGTGRNSNGLHSSGFQMIPLNVNNSESVIEAVNFIVEKELRLDILVNNAGIGMAGVVEEISDEWATQIFDTNVIGLQRTCSAVIPQMRKQNYGKIINVGSMAGLIGLPFRAHYCATKFATEGYSEALSMELRKFGIKVSIIEPGDVKTTISNNRWELETDSNSAYYKDFNHVRNLFNNGVSNGYHPIEIAKIVETIVETKNPKFRYRKGNFFENFTLFVKKIVPFRLFEKLVCSYYQMKP